MNNLLVSIPMIIMVIVICITVFHTVKAATDNMVLKAEKKCKLPNPTDPVAQRIQEMSVAIDEMEDKDQMKLLTSIIDIEKQMSLYETIKTVDKLLDLCHQTGSDVPTRKRIGRLTEHILTKLEEYNGLSAFEKDQPKITDDK